MVTLSTEQFQQLLGSVNRPNERCGSFSSCSARYNGERNPSKVEEFIAAISTFKLVEKIPDADAVNGMPMLLVDDAAEWWRGVRTNVKSFEDVVRMLRESFSPPKPAWRIYAEIYEVKQQKNEPTDSFIRKKRALFAQLNKCPSEPDQLDMLFGMLHSQIRERLFRNKISSFDEMLADAREAEYVLCERSTVNTDVGKVPSGPEGGPKRCSFCRKKGHTIDNCFKKQDIVAKQQPVRIDPALLKPKFACYGCNAPGVVRANCPNCSKKTGDVSPTGVSFNSLGLCIGRNIPVVNVQMFGVPGQAYFDSGAKTSVASTNLKKIMDFEGCQYESILCNVSLADGTTCNRKCLTTECKIVLGGRCLNIKFLIFPEDRSNRTLIGSDFMEQAGIVLNMGQRYWYFENCPTQQFDFCESWPLNLNLLETIGVVGTRVKRGTPKTVSEFPTVTPKRICRTHVSDFESYGLDYCKESDYSPHSIQAIFRDAIPIDMTTPDRAKDCGLFSGVVYRPQMDDEKNPIFTPLYSLDYKVLKPTDGAELTNEQREQLDSVLVKHSAVFGSLGRPSPYAVHKIDTGNHEPISSPPYRLSFAKARELRSEIDNMLENDIIEECDSAWASPVVMVPKRDGSIRVCVDYRKLNAVTVPDRYPLPRMDDLLHSAKTSKYMTTLDLQCGYYQIEVAAEDRDKTCLITPFGTYRFKRMPFGLRNAPATFQRLINRFKSGIAGICIFAYLDDIIICSENFQKHLENLDEVLNRLLLFELCLNNQKCKFCCSSVKFLGYILTTHGIAVDPDKIKAITERKEPRNIKELISFMQTCSWYRRFISRYAEIARPLTNLTKKTAVWKWGEVELNSFNALKEALTTSPVLKQAVDYMPYSIRTDASAYAIGAVLLQGEGPTEHPIEYASRLLNNAERNYSTTEREALALIWACSKFRGYIEGEEIRLLTDHKPLKWLLTLKSPTGRLARWGLQIQHYNFTIEHISGKSNAVADMLSRPPCNSHDSDEGNCFCAFYVDMPSRKATDIRNEQMKDGYLNDIIASLEKQDENFIRWINRSYLLNDGVLYRYANDDCEDAQLVIPIQERPEILKAYHDESTAGHYGVERTTARIADRYFWPGMRSDIAKYVKNCIECQRFKATNMKPVGLLQTTSSKQRFEVVAVDLFGPLPQTEEGFRWILIVEDVASRWVELFKLQDATAEVCAKILIDEIFLRYGLPRRIKSDNGVQFVSAIMQQVTFCLDIYQQFTPVYHPEANPVERKNRDLKSQLAILVQDQHNKWDQSLAAIRFAMNTSKCQSTGYSAAYLTFGRELRTLDDVKHDVKSIIDSESFIPGITSYLQTISNALENAKETEAKIQDKNKVYVDQQRRPQPHFEVGTEVLVTTHILSNAGKGISAKFVPKRDGPYIITKKIGSSTYEIASPDNLEIPLGTYHASALTLYKGTNRRKTPTPVHPMKRRGRPRRS